MLENCIQFNKNLWFIIVGQRILIRNLGNKLGLAWWAKVETETPSVTYWYGPFLTKNSLIGNLKNFLKDLSEEGSKDIKHSILRCNKEEPLTV